MPLLLIKDYLQTQGLRLPEEEIRLNYLAAKTVIDIGEASIDSSLLWYGGETVLSDYLARNAENEARLKQVFMALDSVFSRQNGVQSAAVYALMPSESGRASLLLLAQQGEALERRLGVDEAGAQQHLPVRTAQTGWLNIAGDVAQWLAQNELRGGHNGRCQSQMSLPVCSQNGAVLGVVYVEYARKEALDEAAQAAWTALSLALAEPVEALSGTEKKETSNEHTR